MSDKIILTIARQFGSGGREVGRKLADRMCIPFYDKELISLNAKESGYNKEILEECDEKETTFFDFVPAMGSNALWTNISFQYNMPITERVFQIQSDTIKKIASEGSCVIVGRCADFLLADNPGRISVFIHGSIESRIRRAVEQYGIPAKNPQREIEAIDKKRSNYYSYHTGLRWGEAENYDLSLDSDKIGIDGCVDVILSYVEEKKRILSNM